MWILIAGPYSAETAENRLQNLKNINQVALPVVGEDSSDKQRYADIMQISLAVAKRCDAVLGIVSSPGADRKVQLLAAQGEPVFEKYR